MGTWKQVVASEFIEFNPKETLKKGTIAPKISMDILAPFTRKVSSYTQESYNGGTKFRNQDTIMARITPCLENGKTSMVDILPEDTVGFGSTEYIVFRARSGISDSKFVYYLACSNVIRDIAIKSMVGSSGRQRVQQSVVNNIEFMAPALEEQKRIAAVLSSLDDKIELNNVINENLEQQAQLIFQQYFSNDSSFVALDKVVNTTSGGTPSRKHDDYYINGSICWVKSKELLGSYIIDTEEKINDIAISNSSAKQLPAHSVLIAMYGATVGEYGIISVPMTCNQAVCALLHNEKYPYTYLFMLAKTSKNKLINMAVGSAQQNISQILIKQLLVHKNTDKIKEYHEIVLPLFQEMEQLHYQNSYLRQLRDSLLPKLMSGKIDVSAVTI